MSTRKKIITWLFRILVVLIILIVVTMVLSPRLINLDLVRSSIRDRMSHDLGAEIKYRQMVLSYIPRPHVVIHRAEITIPDSFTIKIHRLKIYPKILPLLRGDLQVSSVRLKYADYFMKLPQISDTAPQPGETISFDTIVREITTAVKGLPGFKLPDLNLKVKYGNVNLVDPFGRKFKLRELHAGYHGSPDQVDFSIRCKSNLWEKIEVNGFLNPSDFKGRGKIQLSRFRPQTLLAYLMPNSALQITEARANLTIDFESQGAGKLTADFDGAIPVVELRHGGKKLAFKGSHIRGTFAVGDKAINARVTELEMDYPQLKATAMFAYDDDQHDIRLAINGSEIHVDSVRKMALALAGESEIVREIFNIVRGGHVPWISVEVQGHSMVELGMLDNIVIKARMTRGKIYIPGVELDLEDVYGDALIAGGILNGANLQARMGKTHGQNGTLKLGLNEAIAPFKLKIDVNADLTQLPPVLNRIVDDRDFHNELANISELQGSAVGILTLGDELENLKATVEVSKASLSARYKHIPYPLKLDGGHFVYDGDRITIENFNAAIGNSSLQQFSSAIDWTGTPSLDFNTKSATFHLNELYSWLLSFEMFRKRFEYIRSLEGDASVENLTIKGPLFSPIDWHFKTRGAVNRLIVTSDRLTKSLQVSKGQFSWQGTRIAFNDLNATLGRSSAMHITGDVNWAQTPIFSARSGPASVYLDDINPIIFSFTNIADALDPFKPLSGALAFNSLAIRCPVSEPTAGKLSFSSDVKQLTITSQRLPGPLRIDKGQISWNQTKFTITDIDASLGKSTLSQLSAGFDLGQRPSFEIQSKSVKLIAAEIHPWLSSFENFWSAARDFRAIAGILALHNLNLKGPIHQPSQWYYQVNADMQNLVLNADAFKEPVTVTHGAFDLTSEVSDDGPRKKVNIKNTNLTWGNNHLTLSGDMTLAEKDILLDSKISADGIDWVQIKSILDYIQQKKADPQSPSPDRQVLGTLKVYTEKFNYDSYSVQPLEAQISFKPDKVSIAIEQAVVCSINFRGLLNVHGQTLEIYLVPAATDQKLAPALACVTGQKETATGTFNLSGELLSKSKPEAFVQSLAGNLAFTAKEGRIYRFGLLAKILAILNVTEIYRGEVPDLTGKGFAYRSMTAHAQIKGGKLILQDSSIDGVSMGIACEGNIDFAEKKMDLTILVAPFKTVDRIVDFIPLVGHILGGKLISIPFKAKGDLKDPDIIPLPPMAVGSGVLGILERTLKLPITIIQPVFSGGKKKKDQKKPE